MTEKLDFKKQQAIFTLITLYNKIASEYDQFYYMDTDSMEVESTIRLYKRFEENYYKTIEELREEISNVMTYDIDDPYKQPLCDLSNEFFEQLYYMEFEL